MGYKQRKFVPVLEGGTGTGSFTSCAVVCGGATSTDALVSLIGVGESSQVLTSQGAGMLPTWAELDNETFFERLASDPVSPVEGQTWYNTTSHEFKGYLPSISTGAWFNVAIYPVPTSGKITNVSSVGANGDDALTFGGQFGQVSSSSDPFTTNKCFLYDGIGDSWSTKQVSNFNYAGRGSAGSSSSEALAVAGFLVPSTASGNPSAYKKDSERYSLTANTWTTVAQFIVACYKMNGSGTPSNALMASAYIPTNMVYSTSQYFNGVAWSSKAVINTSRLYPGSNSCMAASGGGVLVGGQTIPGGFNPVYSSCERYNSASNVWTFIGSINIARYLSSGSGASADAVFSWGGNIQNSASQSVSEKYSGISNTWTVAENMVAPNNNCSGAGTTTSALTVARVNTFNNVQKYGGTFTAGVVIFDVS